MVNMPIDDIKNFTINIAENGNNYYVSKNGSDSNDGSLNYPWKTIQKAANTAEAGDIVNIMGGTYQEQVETVNSGTAGNFISFKNYNSDIPIIDGSFMTSTWDGLVAVRGQSFLRFSGLKIANASAYGLYFPLETNNIIIDNCEIYSCSLSGIYMYPANPTYVTNVLIENNVLYDNHNWWNWPEGEGPNETVTISNVDNFIFRYNYLYNNHKLPFDAKNNSRNGEIYGNIIDSYATEPYIYCAGFYIDAYDDHAMDINVYNNIVYGPHTGYTIGTEQGGTLHRIKMFNNIYYGTGHAFQINDHWQYSGGTPGVNHVKAECCIINNTICNASAGIFITDLQDSFYYNDFIIRNNILSTNGSGIYCPAKAVNLDTQELDHNCFHETHSSTYYGTDNVIGNPLFVDAANNNFHLQSNSPCINAGSSSDAPLYDFDGNSRVMPPDIGAYEYV